MLANFQGPFSTHPVMARALRVPGPKLRLRIPPDCGGSFGIKLSVFPYIVLASIAARVTGRPVKWVEDRVEHLIAASIGPNRVTEIEAAVTKDGRILALRMDQLEDYGAFLRAPMPGPLYRMHGAVTGAYDIANIDVVNRVVLDQQDAGEPDSRLRRSAALPGAGAAGAAHRDRARARSSRRHQAQPGAGGQISVPRRGRRALRFRRLSARGRDRGRRRPARRPQARRDAARAAGRHYGIGFAAVVEPAMSNMGYLSTLLTPEARDKAGPKNGAVSMVTVNIDPLGAVSVTADVTVQGQGHETVLSQIVADQLGLRPDDVDVTLEMDTAKDQWSIAAGTYSCRFTPGTAVAAHMAAARMADKLKDIARQAAQRAARRRRAVAAARSAAAAIPTTRCRSAASPAPRTGRRSCCPKAWQPALSETAVWTPPELEPPSSDDRINTSLTYGFVFDMCGIEIDPMTYQVRVDRYVSMHDAGKLLNPMIAEGQIRGAFVQGIATALYEEFVNNEDGAFLTGTFADYLVPTVSEIPPVEMLHRRSPSPFTPLGAKGLAEGNCMSVPVCIANAIADALGVKDVRVPVTPRRIYELMTGEGAA